MGSGYLALITLLISWLCLFMSISSFFVSPVSANMERAGVDVSPYLWYRVNLVQICCRFGEAKVYLLNIWCNAVRLLAVQQGGQKVINVHCFEQHTKTCPSMTP